MALIELKMEQSGILVMELNRPEQAHSLSKPLLQELNDTVRTLRSNSEVRAVIITSKGEKVFSAGADLKERAGMNEQEVLEAVHFIQSVVNGVAQIPQPTIAALTGSALGGGLELALAADIRIGANNAKYGLPETTLAIIPGAGGTQRLARLIGIGKAKQLIYTGQIIDGKEAEQLGIFEKSVPVEDVLSEAFALAKQITKNGPIALKQAKRAIDLGADTDLTSGLAIERACYEHTIPTADRNEGLLAFKEKRKAEYIGK